MAMTVTKALQEWETKTGNRAADATQIKLLCCNPPITKMDPGLNQLVNCTKLSLSTNSIDKITNVSGLRNLEILSLGRNVIKKISGLEEVGATLRELWISYNQIEKLDGLQSCTNLSVLLISNNRIKNWEEISRLNQLPALTNVLLNGNPIYEQMANKEEIRPAVIKRCPLISVLDGSIVSDQVRKAAEELKD